VEAIVSGDAQAVQAIIDWAWRGPSSAQVSDVVVIDVDDALVSDEEFEMRATE
jgi:acylphosphatase